MLHIFSLGLTGILTFLFINCSTLIIINSITFLLIGSATFLLLNGLALVLVFCGALLFWNLLALLFWHRLCSGHLNSMALLPGNIINFIIIDSATFLVISSLTLLRIRGRGNRLLYSITLLCRLVPTFILPDGAAGWDTGHTAANGQQQ